MVKRWLAGLWLVGLLVPAAPFLSQAQAEETVTIQLVKSTGQAPFYIAIGKGYFEKEGIHVDSGNVRSALDTIAPMATGRLDGSMGAATAGFFNAAHQGFDMRIVAVMGIQGHLMATQALVRKDLWDNGTIKSAKDYRGRKIAINAPGDITEYFLTKMLGKYGMTLKDVNETSMEFALQVVAFKNSAIDAGFLPEPLATTAKSQGEAVLDQPEQSIGEGIPTTFLFLATKFMQDRPKVALAFMRALIRGARDAQGDFSKNPDVAAMIAKQTDLKLADVENSAPYVFDPNLDITKFEGKLRDEETVHRANGRLNYTEPLSFDKVIDAKLVHQAAAQVK
ncbi:MAG TPA: ABC transporter substrate-binding protein [Stellaceae bacterium]|nr:ABC transporter substrate-binding protein [Stellaceae bacterium]